MPPKKSTLSQIATSSQISRHNTSQSDDQDDDHHYETDANFKQMVNASIQYVLIHSSKAQVIKRLDWTNTVLRPMANDGRKYFPAVHKQVVNILQDTFGYKLVFDQPHDGEKNPFNMIYLFPRRLYLSQWINQRPLRKSSISKCESTFKICSINDYRCLFKTSRW